MPRVLHYSASFELYMRGGCLNHEAKPSGLNTAPRACNSINHDKAIV